MVRTSSPTVTDSNVSSVREQQGVRSWKAVNLHVVERWLSGLGGATLTTYGLLRRDWPGFALAAAGSALTLRGISGHSYLYQGFGINTSGRALPPGASVPHGQGIKIKKAMTIERSPQELYQYWRHFEHLPQFITTLKEINILDETHSHWVVKAPAGRKIEWDAEVINDQENELIAWRSLPGSEIAHAGSIHFTPAPGGRGTEIKVVLEYVPPTAGRPGALIAKVFGKEPEQQAQEGLRHFKEIMEAGEIPAIKGQPVGRR